tara:strand:- start:202 stop:408 length:207 start_codon:yes stop_codon:yes gene_type:complete
MFGQTAGIGSTSANNSTLSKVGNKSTEIKIHTKKPYNLDKKIIKVVDFDKQNKSAKKNPDKKIKIKTF